MYFIGTAWTIIHVCSCVYSTIPGPLIARMGPGECEDLDVTCNNVTIGMGPRVVYIGFCSYYHEQNPYISFMCFSLTKGQCLKQNILSVLAAHQPFYILIDIFNCWLVQIISSNFLLF